MLINNSHYFDCFNAVAQVYLGACCSVQKAELFSDAASNPVGNSWDISCGTVPNELADHVLSELGPHVEEPPHVVVEVIQQLGVTQLDPFQIEFVCSDHIIAAIGHQPNP